MEEKKCTEKIYYENVRQTSFRAKVILVDTAGEEISRVVLDRTAFYPEGGGQPCDLGKLGGREVLDVQEEEGLIIHQIRGTLQEGEMVVGEIDWARRFDLMQQHSGEHIVSGMVHELYGYRNVGFHMGEDLITIDFDGILEEEELTHLEERVNRYLWENHPVQVLYPSDEELLNMDYRSKKELTGQVRLVSFPGADLCACCGTHVENTGEIGLVKLLSCHRFRQGVRVEMLSGKRAFDYLTVHYRQNSINARTLSVKPDDTVRAVDHLQAELYRLRGELMEARGRIHSQIARICRGRTKAAVLTEAMNPADIRKTLDQILDQACGPCILIAGEDGAYKYALGERDGDVRQLNQRLGEALQGRGGGKPFFVQGSLQASGSRIRTFLEAEGFDVFMIE